MMNDFENQLDTIRVEIYEQTKHMSNAEAVKAANDHGRELAAKYGVKVVKRASASPAQRAGTL